MPKLGAFAIAVPKENVELAPGGLAGVEDAPN